MTETKVNEPAKARRRQIGNVGTVARVLIGLFIDYERRLKSTQSDRH